MTNDSDARKRYIELATEIKAHVGLADLTTPELIDLAALLIPAHRRVLAERPPTPVSGAKRLHIVGNQTPG